MTEERAGQAELEQLERLDLKERRAILVAAGEDRQMEELGRLSETLGLEVVGVL